MNDGGGTRVAGHLLVVSAPSGAGKTSLVQALVESEPDLYVSVSHTTRPQRAGEIDGEDYHFIDDEAFAGMVAADQFLEHAAVFDHRYGTSRRAVDDHLARGEDVILEIDWQGARSVRAAAPDAVSVFILPPSVSELERRLRGRGDPAEGIERRMRDAVSEMNHYDEYDYLVINDDFEHALAALRAVLRAARLRLEVQRNRHAALLADLVAR